jgi:hypothetical protein
VDRWSVLSHCFNAVFFSLAVLPIFPSNFAPAGFLGLWSGIVVGLHWQTQRDPFERPRLARGPRYLYAMLLRPAYLCQNLDRPLPTKDGGTLRTIGEAVDYMTSIGKKRELRTHWQRVCKLILAKEDVLTVSRALELALFMDAESDVSKLGATGVS